MNQMTLLRLAGLCSVYDQFGKIVNASQEVHLMPFQRLDKFEAALKKLKEELGFVKDLANVRTTVEEIEKKLFSCERKNS